MEKLRKLNTEYEGKGNIVILKLLGGKMKWMDQTCQIGLWMGLCTTLKISGGEGGGTKIWEGILAGGRQAGLSLDLCWG